MAAITALTRDFDGTDGTTASAAGIGASQITGGGVSTFSAAHAISGTCWSLNCTANNIIAVFPIGSSKATAWVSFYGTTPSALPAANLTILQTYGDSNVNQAVSVRWLTDGSMQLRDNITARGQSSDSAVTVPPNTDFRISVKSNPGGSGNVCRLRLYVGSNKHGTTPDYDSGDQPNTSSAATGVDTVRLGTITNLTGTLFIDRMRGDDATEPTAAVTVGPPTVDAGPDLTKDAGSGNFTILGTQTLVGGATVSSRAWTQDSGPTTLTLSGTTTNTVTVTPPAASGTYVLRYTVTDSNGQVGFDTVTIAFVIPGTALVPIGDVSDAGAWVNQAGGTTNLYQAIDEVPVSTADFITTGQSPSAASYKCRLTAAVAPGNTSGCTLEPTLAIAADVTSYSIVYKVYDGDGTLKKTFTAITSGLSTTPTAVDLSFTPTEIASFAHWDSGIIVERLATAS